MLANVIMLVLLGCSTPNFHDILTQQASIYPPVIYCGKLSFTVMTYRNNQGYKMTTTLNHQEFDNRHMDHLHPLLLSLSYRFELTQ